MEKTRLSNKGQVVIPKAIRELHGWKAGLEFVIENEGDGVRLRPIKAYEETTIDEVIGCTGYRGPRRSLKDMESAIAKGAEESR